MKAFQKFSIVFILSILALISGFFGYYFAVTSGEKLTPEKLVLSQTNVVLYDKDEQLLPTPFSNLKMQSVAIHNIPSHTKQAFVDTEDKRFYSHKGFDYKRIAKSFYNNLKAHSLKQGASTISQQLIKNTHLTQEKTLKRKLKEWKLTRQLEKKYSKDEILERYLNMIYFGHNCFGIRAAAAFYFGKTPDLLDLADSAILAGLVKSPNNYSPFKHAENCQKRKTSVLNAMLKNGSISEEEKLTALKKPLPDAPKTDTNAFDYAHFVFDELSALAEIHGFQVGGNVQIYTYVDQELQANVTKLLNDYRETDKTLLVLDNQTNGFKACVSSVGEIKRLPGSLLKPLLVYAPAIEENLISPATPLLDEEIRYGDYAPRNYDGKFRGYVSARECLAKSLNVPAVKLLECLGTEKAASYLEKNGLPVTQEDKSLALALGGMKNGYSLQSLLSAYATLANGGTHHNASFIKCVHVNGKQVYARSNAQTKVFEKATAYLTTDMLKTAAQTGTAKKLRSLPFEIAAKTGTVGTSKGNTDAYAISYTPLDSVGVWLGNKDNAFITSTGGGYPCNILLDVNEYLFNLYKKQNLSIPAFAKPDNVVNLELDRQTYYDTHTLSLADELSPKEYRFTELFKKDMIPTQKSNFFSNPSLITPILQYKDGKISILFDIQHTSLYRYRIDKYDYVRHTTIFEGKIDGVFTDENVTSGKTYIYTITPIYEKRYGTPVTLPAVSTKEGLQTPNAEREILEKEWWDY